MLGFASLGLLCLIFAQAQEDRVVLRGNVPPQATPENDAGPVRPSFKMTGLAIQFKRSPAQQHALDQLLKDQQDPASPRYHKWVTPEEIAERFGLSRADIGRISSWLRSHGFRIGQVGRGREWITFSGTAKQVNEAFHVEIRRYRVENKLHYANSSDPSIPAAFQDLVNGIRGLDDFTPSPL